MADAMAQWETDLAQITELDEGALRALEASLVDAFDNADQSGDEQSMTQIADALDTVRAEIAKRSEAPQPEPVAADGEPPADPPETEKTVSEASDATAETTETTTAETDNSTEPQAQVEGEATTETTVTETTEPQAQVEGEGSADEEVSTAELAEPVAAAGEGDEPPSATTDSSAPEEGGSTEKEEGTTVATGTVAVPKGREPVVASASPSIVLAGADIPGYTAGHQFTSSEEFGKALAARINTVRHMSGGSGEQIVVASVRSEAPADRILKFSEPEQTWAKIQEVTHPDSITAAGGCCAPLTTRYELFDCGGVTDRPVRDALAGFQADRGGIRYYPGPALSDLTGATGFWTCEDDEDALDTNGPTKVCARINCPPEQTAELQAVTLCITFGVLQGRIFPEVAVANNKLALVSHSRIAEAALLAQIKAGSKQIADTGTPLSAVRDILDTIGRAAMYFRDRYRLNGRVPLRAIFPLWVLELLRGDVAWGEPVGSLRESLSLTDGDIQQFFSDRNINVTWSLDSSEPGTLGGGFFANASTTLPAWPTSVQWALFPEGSWLFLDGGSLDLGVIRDSGLVRKNDYMQFSETFESAANIGCESLWITSSVAVSGIYNCSCS